MTSRISFVKRLKEESKHHLISVFIVLLVTLTQVLAFYFEMQLYVEGPVDMVYKKGEFAAIAEPNSWTAVPTIFLAILLATEYFSFLHSKKKSDFYFSLPIKREEQFWLGAGTCGIIFLIPLMVEIIIKIVMTYAVGGGSAEFLYNIVWYFICTVIIFSTSWITMTLAMVTTGNTMVALMGYAAFAGYIPVIIKQLVPTFQEMYFVTYHQVPNDSMIWNCLSPIGLTRGITGMSSRWALEEHAKYIIASVIFLVLVGGLTIRLYKRRPTEAAGRAMSFEKVNSIVRFAVVIPLALYCGVLLHELSVQESKIWLLAGTVLGAFLLHGAMECIFAFDMRKMFSKKRHFIISCLLCVAFLAYFELDLTNYNAYVPDESEVEKIYVSFGDDYLNYYNDINFIKENSKKGISGENIKTIINLVENAIADSNWDENTKRTMESVPGKHNLGNITVQYVLKNGRSKGRTYTISFENEENRKLLDAVFATEDMKDDFYNLYTKNVEEIKSIQLDAMLNIYQIMLNENEKEELIDIYLKEFAETSYSQMSKEDKIASMAVFYRNNESEDYYILESFENTIDFLEQHGYKIDSTFAECKVIDMDIYDENGLKTVDVIDGSILEKYKNELLLSNYYQNYYVYGLKDSVYGNVKIEINGRYDSEEVLIRNSTLQKIQNEMK